MPKSQRVPYSAAKPGPWPSATMTESTRSSSYAVAVSTNARPSTVTAGVEATREAANGRSSTNAVNFRVAVRF